MLSKSQFLDFQHCAKSFWLKAKRPDAIDWPAPSAFDRMLMNDGYAVEREARRLVANWPDAAECEFQRVFQTPNLYARADLVRRIEGGAIDIFEIKGSTSIKVTTDRDHIADTAFQVHTARASGQAINRSYLVHLNSEYVREADIVPEELLTIVDVTDEVEARLPGIALAIEEALALLNQEAIDEAGCTCVAFGSVDKRCAAFDHFNPGIPELSIYLLPRISAKKVEQFRTEGRLALGDIRPDELTATQIPVHAAALQGAPVIDKMAIRAFVADCAWPLHFYDYETFGSAVPYAANHGPFQQIPVQYSLHRLHADGTLEHFEYLTTVHGGQRGLVEHMEASFAGAGTIVSWNKSFENSCNTRMAKLLPDKAEFLMQLNERTIDLMDPFKSDYVDIQFKGSTSIKKVLPVLCPALRYDDEVVHDGAGAMEAWLQMIDAEEEAERARLASELRAYCGLDTFAMVEIYKVLASI
jgi:hypothetical protein